MGEDFHKDGRSRLGWFGNGTGIHAYHTWLILEKGDGCLVVTEETQNGPSAIAFNLDQPTAMYYALIIDGLTR